MPVLSVVVPMYNEAEVLPLFAARLRPVLDGLREDDGSATSYEVVAVDDGSADDTAAILETMLGDWPQLRLIRLAANSGHQAAISAGLEVARGDWVVTIDADLQDPPETIERMLTVGRTQGVDVIYGVRTDRSTDTRFKRGTAHAFYRVARLATGIDAPFDAADYRMMSRAAVDAVNQVPLTGRVLRMAVPQMRMPSATVGFAREERAAGESKYPLSKMLKLSADAILGYARIPAIRRAGKGLRRKLNHGADGPSYEIASDSLTQ